MFLYKEPQTTFYWFFKTILVCNILFFIYFFTMSEVCFDILLLFSGFVCDVESNEGVLVPERGCETHCVEDQENPREPRSYGGFENVGLVVVASTVSRVVVASAVSRAGLNIQGVQEILV